MPDAATGASESPGSSPKDLFERFGITEILAHLFPGAIALCSLFVWGATNPEEVLGKKLASDLVVGAMLLIFAYACGLVISMWSLSGAETYRARPPLTRPMHWKGYPSYIRRWIKSRWLRFAVGLPDPYASDATVYANLDVAEMLEGVYGVNSMPLLPQPGERLSLFRTIASDVFKEKISSIIAEAEILHRRLMFSLGVALALLFLALSTAARLFVAGLAAFWNNRQLRDWTQHHESSVVLLLVVTVGTLYASFKLRRVAAQCWERELVLTLSIARLFVSQS